MADLDKLQEDVARVREDVAAIKERIDALPDHEQRLRSLERWKWGLPLAGLLSLFGLGSHAT